MEPRQVKTKPRRRASAKSRSDVKTFVRRSDPDHKQVSFYCTQELLDQLRIEKVRRDLTIQEMITTALAEYIRRSPAEAQRPRDAESPEKTEQRRLAPAAEVQDDYETQRQLDLCSKYFRRMPKAKRTILEEFIVLDLKHYGSSRLKETD
jgi:hypothetical protein